MASSRDQCHLLRISQELRDFIYDYVIHFDPPNETVCGYKNGFRERSFYTAIVETAGKNFFIPWVNLKLTCKAISTDITNYLNARSKVDNEERQTWALDLVARGGALKSALWRQIPCQPGKDVVLLANIDLTERVHFWGDGGPMPIVRNLFQTLNWILHYGPAFGRQVPLSQPLRFKTLVLRVKISSSSDRQYRELCRFVQTIERIGVLSGYIDSIHIIHEGSQEKKHVAVRFFENGRVPEYWNGYGFEWGPVKAKG